MKRFKHDATRWTGESVNDVPEGLGTLTHEHPDVGSYVQFDGLMHNGRFVSGKLFKVRQREVYLAFEGTFSGDGTLFDHTGTVKFEGPFLNGRPNGFGYGTVALHGIESDFSGSLDPFYSSGRLTFDGSVYTGALHPQTGLPSGHGLFREGPFLYLDGLFEPRVSDIRVTGRGPFHDMIDDTFPPARFVNGSFSFIAFHVVLHGLCGVVFQCGSDLLKLVGTFDHDVLGDTFDVYKIDETDAIFTTDSLRTGQHLVRVNRSDTRPTTLELFDQNSVVYSGRGFFVLDAEFYEFRPHGIGTQYLAGLPTLIADFYSDTIRCVYALFDSEGDLLFRLSDEDLDVTNSQYLHGTGLVFSKSGHPLYTATFRQGHFVNFEAVLQTLPRAPISDVHDPITKDQIPKGRLVVKVNGNVYAKTTLQTFWAHHPFCADPVFGTYALRFEVYKVV